MLTWSSTTGRDLYRTPAEVYQNGQEEKKVAAQEVGLPSGVVKTSVGAGDSLNLALGLAVGLNISEPELTEVAHSPTPLDSSWSVCGGASSLRRCI